MTWPAAVAGFGPLVWALSIDIPGGAVVISMIAAHVGREALAEHVAVLRVERAERLEADRADYGRATMTWIVTAIVSAGDVRQGGPGQAVPPGHPTTVAGPASSESR